MPNSSLRVPSYRHHRASGQAVVTINGRDIYLGKHNSAASRTEYKRVIAEWTTDDGTPPQTLGSHITVIEVAAAFLRHAKQYYRRPDGTQTNEVKNIKLTMQTYTDPRLLDEAEALAALPDLPLLAEAETDRVDGRIIKGEEG